MARLKINILTKEGTTLVATGSRYKGRKVDGKWMSSRKLALRAIPELRQLLKQQLDFLEETGEPTISILDKIVEAKDIADINYSVTLF